MIDYNKIEKVGEYKDGALSWFAGEERNAIYLIRIEENIYIGSTKNLRSRVLNHISILNKNFHSSYKMQSAFNSHKKFTVFLLERVLDLTQLKIREQYYIDYYVPNLNVIPASTKVEYNPISARIKEIMQEKGVSSVLLAEKIGVSKVTVSNLINNKTMPSLKTMEDIANALEVPMWQLFASPEEVGGNTFTCPKCGARLKLVENTKE